jgi:proton-coupled amino acid transporter
MTYESIIEGDAIHLYCLLQVMPLENSMKNPSHFIGKVGILNIAMFIVVVLYTVIGFFGYIKYGGAVQGSITLNLLESDM